MVNNILMVKKIYCDYCGDEIGTKDHPLELFINGDDKDICDKCGEKVGETLSSLSKS